ncbi:MAG TPA: GNAT family N-acetyltransferase [Micromonosporaceae bacterium]
MHIEPCERRDLASFDDYRRSLSATYDSYLEKIIDDSQFYRVSIDGVEIGGFAIHDGSLLTYFHLFGGAIRHSPEVWARVMGEYPITAANVPTCDEQLLAQALDNYREIKKQACCFIEGGTNVETDIGVTFRPSVESDLDTIVAVSGDFLEPVADRLANGEIHVGIDGGEMVAVGLAEPAIFLGNYASIGMFTHPEHRNRGIGTAMIRHLRRVCRDAGITPISGCWYYNDASRRTLEAAGMVTKTRLLRVEYDREA